MTLHTEIDADLVKQLSEGSAGWETVAARHALTIMRLRAVLQMGLQLGESGKHGDGPSCPTCHFVREARKVLADGESQAKPDLVYKFGQPTEEKAKRNRANDEQVGDGKP